MSNVFIPEISLPISSFAENLETISRNKMQLLFDPSLFEIRSENQRDKGVDFTAELKCNGAYTNFRFAIQLKSVASVSVNKDNSISYPVEVSNIHYLLNYPMPAYYILYDHKADVFYYEHVFVVHQLLIKKYKNSDLPNKYTVRFFKLLDANIIHYIYNKSLANGSLLRSLNPHLEHSFSNPNVQSGIVIDENRTVYSVEENLAYIDRYGYALLSQAAYNTIINIEQRTHPRKKVSPLFNLVCGLAYFYKERVYKALDFLQMAQRQGEGFEPEIKTMLNYTILQAKYNIGSLDIENLNVQTQLLMDGENIGSFLEIEKAWKALQNNAENDQDKLKTLYTTLKNIIEKESENPKARMIAYARILEAEFKFLINDLRKNLSSVVGIGYRAKKTNIYAVWKTLEDRFHERLDRLVQYAVEANDLQTITNLTRMKIEWHYQYAFTSHFFNHWSFQSLQSEGEIVDKIRIKLLKDCDFIDEIMNLFKLADHPENLLLCLKLKYELLYFLKDYIKADKVKELIISTIDEYDLSLLRNNFDEVLRNGTEWEQFKAQASANLKQVYKVAKHEGIEKYFLMNDSSPNADPVVFEWTVNEFMKFEFPDIKEKNDKHYGNRRKT